MQVLEQQYLIRKPVQNNERMPYKKMSNFSFMVLDEGSMYAISVHVHIFNANSLGISSYMQAFYFEMTFNMDHAEIKQKSIQL